MPWKIGREELFGGKTFVGFVVTTLIGPHIGSSNTPLKGIQPLFTRAVKDLFGTIDSVDSKIIEAHGVCLTLFDHILGFSNVGGGFWSPP